MSTMLPNPRICTICGDVFEAVRKAGRPPAFCSDACKATSKTTHQRVCIICRGGFLNTDRPGTSSPFYCSDACSTIKSLCLHCGLPVRAKGHNFCSVTCMQTRHPGPYTCRRCHKEFMPSAHWLSTDGPLKNGPTYCSSECFEHRWTPATSKHLPNRDQTAKFLIAYNEWDRFRPNELELPTRRGIVYYNVDPADLPEYESFPKDKRLDPRVENAINFWRYVLDEGFFEHQTAEQLYVAMCLRTAGTIIKGHGIFPWIQPHINHSEFDVRKFVRFNSIHVQATHAKAKGRGAMSKERMRELLNKANDHFLIWQNVRTPPQSEREAANRWIEYWLKPRREADNRALIQIEAARFSDSRSIDPDDLEHYMGITPSQYEDCDFVRDYFAKTMAEPKPLPWGEDLRAEISSRPVSSFDSMVDLARGGYYVADPLVQHEFYLKGVDRDRQEFA
jgi:hypothetical protein